MSIKATVKINPNLTYNPAELRKKFPWAVNSKTREEVEGEMRTEMGRLGLTEEDFPKLMQRWEETYGFKEDAENEFGEVSP